MSPIKRPPERPTASASTRSPKRPPPVGPPIQYFTPVTHDHAGGRPSRASVPDSWLPGPPGTDERLQSRVARKGRDDGAADGKGRGGIRRIVANGVLEVRGHARPIRHAIERAHRFKRQWPREVTRERHAKSDPRIESRLRGEQRERVAVRLRLRAGNPRERQAASPVRAGGQLPRMARRGRLRPGRGGHRQHGHHDQHRNRRPSDPAPRRLGRRHLACTASSKDAPAPPRGTLTRCERTSAGNSGSPRCPCRRPSTRRRRPAARPGGDRGPAGATR